MIYWKRLLLGATGTKKRGGGVQGWTVRGEKKVCAREGGGGAVSDGPD